MGLEVCALQAGGDISKKDVKGMEDGERGVGLWHMAWGFYEKRVFPNGYFTSNKEGKGVKSILDIIFPQQSFPGKQFAYILSKESDTQKG